MDDNADGSLSSQARARGNREVNPRGIGVGDSIDRQSGLMRERDVLWPTACAHPENGLPVLRETSWREVADAIDASGDTFQPPTLRQPEPAAM